ncbi:hypothetical protein NBH19_08090 [Rhizobium sp. S95]|uniref:Uncharacterized protein n=1 Tax=Ciceribacter sichuanensis TaxID=2949647 RepID=A0AAJ1C1R4_9HYPH|nr:MULTISPECIES: hypothetical protein [unclassified Ciceribacter]MCM2396041.1 hypothetical protein [Ciceribacter sp. S95]MCO5960189.1 hypothetical protein [Ciceribacter sp. S101]
MKDHEEINKTDRSVILGKLEVGDIFHGKSKSGGRLTCLVTKINDTHITSRRVTTQQTFVFDKVTGTSAPTDEHDGGVIESVEPLPVDIHNILVALDRRYRLGKNRKESVKLRNEEQEALLFLGDYYEKYPI